MNELVKKIENEFKVLENDIRTNCGELSPETVDGLVLMFKKYTTNIIKIVNGGERLADEDL